MNRRTTLARLLGRGKQPTKNVQKNVRPSAAAVVTGLTPYTGTFGLNEAAHLLRRTTMGVTYAQIQAAANNGLAATVATLLATLPEPAPPVNYRDFGDPNLPIGADWTEVPYNADGSGKGDRKRSMDAWTMYTLLQDNLNIRERMTIFWHNHFAIEKQKVADPKFLYKYIKLLRTNCLGNFRQLAKDITIDPAMVYYLDGTVNTKNNPNENYAREVLELFTVGKGPIIAPGDYSNYTEQDVLELAKVFTGWKARGRNSSTVGAPYVEFLSNNHDTTDKQLSYHFNNAVITNANELEYANAIDIIFQNDAAAYHICRKLYRYFVNFDTAPVEASVITPMAQCLLANDYDILPVVETLLKSQHFYDAGIRGDIIKNPLEFVSNILIAFEMPTPPGPLDWYGPFNSYNDAYMGEMGMEYYVPPSVAGWQAYYLEPQFSELWVNSVTIRPRVDFSSRLAQNGRTLNGFKFQLDVLTFVSTLNNPYDPNDLINEIAFILFPNEIEQGQKDYLKEILIPGLPDFEWTVEYDAYINDPGNTALANAVTERLRNLIEAMLGMPEFYLM